MPVSESQRYAMALLALAPLRCVEHERRIEREERGRYDERYYCWLLIAAGH